ncbi:septum formation protein Maf [Candidatus Gottesmanbacteria bacterium RIFOXYB1_FULL_47_11]|uniref:Nucleoside triphosphate pyrophosphatase n=1 Tax=Candidatus Gottesmanbacteria bacterium RIFOXYB1_FULL_47_11 TaxID=1798401 RepID=A0A1F6BFH5_9BACT|nr:MAG: septum formation protein Maf [Candidatus Gottesmanbacteria bacterium RIFOXYB1_FULL_47_11]
MKLQFTRKGQDLPPPLPDVILASQSIGRRMLLEKLGLRFRVAVSHVDEDAIVDRDPIKMIQRRAEAKVNELVAHQRVYSIPDARESLIVAADSMAILGKKTYGKSADREGSRTMLKALMGRTHVFATAIAIVLFDGTKVKKSWAKTVKTRVTMRKLSPVEIDSYISRFDFTRFAAAYAINEAPWNLVTKIDGSYTNVIGLPFEVLLPVLRSLKIIV